MVRTTAVGCCARRNAGRWVDWTRIWKTGLELVSGWCCVDERNGVGRRTASSGCGFQSRKTRTMGVLGSAEGGRLMPPRVRPWCASGGRRVAGDGLRCGRAQGNVQVRLWMTRACVTNGCRVCARRVEVIVRRGARRGRSWRGRGWCVCVGVVARVGPLAGAVALAARHGHSGARACARPARRRKFKSRRRALSLSLALACSPALALSRNRGHACEPRRAGRGSAPALGPCPDHATSDGFVCCGMGHGDSALVRLPLAGCGWRRRWRWCGHGRRHGRGRSRSAGGSGGGGDDVRVRGALVRRLGLLTQLQVCMSAVWRYGSRSCTHAHCEGP